MMRQIDCLKDYRQVRCHYATHSPFHSEVRMGYRVTVVIWPRLQPIILFTLSEKYAYIVVFLLLRQF